MRTRSIAAVAGLAVVAVTSYHVFAGPDGAIVKQTCSLSALEQAEDCCAACGCSEKAAPAAAAVAQPAAIIAATPATCSSTTTAALAEAGSCCGTASRATAVTAQADSSLCGSLATLASECNGGMEPIRVTRGVGLVFTVGNGCTESAAKLQQALNSTCAQSLVAEAAQKCQETSKLLASGNVVIDRVTFRTGGMILATSSDAQEVAQLQSFFVDQVQVASAK